MIRPPTVWFSKAPRSAEARAAAIAKEHQIYAVYEKLCRALAGSDDVEDRKLAIRVVDRLREDRLGIEVDREGVPVREIRDIGRPSASLTTVAKISRMIR
jgi:hypothetical protein